MLFRKRCRFEEIFEEKIKKKINENLIKWAVNRQKSS